MAVPVVLQIVANGDGTSAVQVGTTSYDQAWVTVDDAALNDPAVWALYDHVSNMPINAYGAVRRSRRDEQRQEG